MVRRPLDAYYTPEKMLEALFKRVSISGSVYEPCVGSGHISKFFTQRGYQVLTNDVDKKMVADTHLDARNECAWDRDCDWVVTNPPFSDAYDILVHAHSHAKVGVVFLLRLSFLEPCKNREKFLLKNPPSRVLVLPRVSFTGDGGKDTVTSMWAIWERGVSTQRLEVIPRLEILHK